MAWNEPGNGQRDPWNKNNRPATGKNSLEAVLKQLRGRFGKLLGGPGGVFTILLAVLLAWLLLGSYTIVGASQAGVVLRFGQYARTLEPGFHFRLPAPFESVTKVETSRVRSVSDTVRMLTHDQDIVAIDFTVQYQVADPRKYLYVLSNTDDTIKAAAEAAVRAAVGASNTDQLLAGGGATYAAQARQALQTTLTAYDGGVLLTDLSFQNVAPPQEVKDAFDDVNNAREEQQASQTAAKAYASKVLPQARADAAQSAADAEAYKTDRIARAQGDTERFNLILKEYKAAPEVTRRRLWLETMEQVLAGNPKVLDGSGGRNVINLQLDHADAQTSTKDIAPDASATLQAITPAPDANGKEKQP